MEFGSEIMKTLYDLRGIENRGKNMKRTITLLGEERGRRRRRRNHSVASLNNRIANQYGIYLFFKIIISLVYKFDNISYRL